MARHRRREASLTLPARASVGRTRLGAAIGTGMILGFVAVEVALVVVFVVAGAVTSSLT